MGTGDGGRGTIRRSRGLKAGVLSALFLGSTCVGYRALPYSVRESLTLENDEPWDEMRFDRVRWIARTPWRGDRRPERLLRALMLDDAIARVLRPGMTKREVTDRLGPPDPNPGSEPAGLCYELGPWEGWGMDGADYLAIHLDRAGRVLSFERDHW